MKKAIFLVIPTVFAVILIFVSSLFYKSTDKYVKNPVYTLKEYSGKVALYKNDSATPEKIYNIYVESLPQTDRSALQSGISLGSKQEVENLLQDYDE